MRQRDQSVSRADVPGAATNSQLRTGINDVTATATARVRADLDRGDPALTHDSWVGGLALSGGPLVLAIQVGANDTAVGGGITIRPLPCRGSVQTASEDS